MKNKPTFNVFISSMNRQSIEIANFFEFGQWNVIKKELKKVLKEALKLQMKITDEIVNNDISLSEQFEMIKPFFDENLITMTDQFKKDYKTGKTTIGKYAVEERLRTECMYYFWAKCEYEVYVSDMFNDAIMKKIDVYEQLIMNWNAFKEIVIKEILKISY